jgi:flagellar P-ring protein precursor FlgI
MPARFAKKTGIAKGPEAALAAILAVALLAAVPRAALAVKIADITRIGGQQTNILTGLGLVYGLKGTGDGGEFSAAINPLREMLSLFNDPVTVKELSSASNVAVVALLATVPANGVHAGDHLDVNVMSLGAASSLKGGRLFVTPMRAAVPKSSPLALAEGPLVIEDPSTPTGGVIRASAGGAVMEVELQASVIDNTGRFSLILDEPSASWTTASTIANIINDSESDSGQTLAVAVSATEVQVTIPANERVHPDSFISRVQRLPVRLLPTEARVQIDTKTNTIVITGDVEISPVVITHKGLSISTIAPPPVPTPQNPVVTTHDVVALGTGTGEGGNLQDLISAMEMLKVSAEDRVEIIVELHKTGKLHAKLIME